MSAKRHAAAVVTAAPAATTSSSLPVGPGTVTNDNSQLPASHRGPIGNIAATSSNFVVSSIGGMFSKMSEYFEMQTISNPKGFGESSSDDYDEDYYDSMDHLEGHPVSNANNNGQRRGIFAGLSSYFQPWKKYQPVPTHNNDNNNGRRNSSSVDGDLSTDSFSSFHDHTSFCEPYPLIDENVNGEGVYVDDGREGEAGEGHKFVPTQLLNIITWCDKCGELIWGFYKQCLRCTLIYISLSRRISVATGAQDTRLSMHYYNTTATTSMLLRNNHGLIHPWKNKLPRNLFSRYKLSVEYNPISCPLQAARVRWAELEQRLQCSTR